MSVLLTLFKTCFLNSSGIEALVSLVIGLAFCLLGEKLFRPLSSISAALLALLSALVISAQLANDTRTNWITGIIAAVIVAVICFMIPALGCLIWCLFILKDILIMFINKKWLILLILAVSLIVLSILLTRKKKAVITVITAVFGAFQFMLAFFSLVSLNTASLYGILWLLASAVLALIGIIIQIRLKFDIKLF